MFYRVYGLELKATGLVLGLLSAVAAFLLFMAYDSQCSSKYSQLNSGKSGGDKSAASAYNRKMAVAYSLFTVGAGFALIVSLLGGMVLSALAPVTNFSGSVMTASLAVWYATQGKKAKLF
jgi:hypothetical protein